MAEKITARISEWLPKEPLFWFCHPCEGCHREGDRSCVCGGSHRVCEKVTASEAREYGLDVSQLEVVR